MSVLLFVESPEEFKNFTVPVSGESYFREIWLPIAEKLELKIIPLFEVGMSFSNQDIPIILKELNLLENEANRLFSPDEHIFARISLLQDGLNTLRNIDNLDFFIG